MIEKIQSMALHRPLSHHLANLGAHRINLNSYLMHFLLPISIFTFLLMFSRLFCPRGLRSSFTSRSPLLGSLTTIIYIFYYYHFPLAIFIA